MEMHCKVRERNRRLFTKMNFDEHYSSFMNYMLTLFVLPQKLNLVILVDKLSIRVKSHLMKFIK